VSLQQGIKIVLAVLAGILMILLIGKLLDLEAERVVLQLYPRDKQGVIEGLGDLKISRQANRALVFIHGFFESPASYLEVIEDITGQINMDIYAPLLPFHARDLAAAARLDNQIILSELKQYLEKLSTQYQSLAVVGFSYGGSLLMELERRKELPLNVHLILVAPAVFIQSNTWGGRLNVQLYGWWRNYCNYSVLGCDFPTYESGDAVAKKMFDEKKSLHYLVIPALHQLYEMDLKNRASMLEMTRPFDLVLALDDNRVDFKEQQKACMQNIKYCHFYAFSSGRHMIHWGANKKRFEGLLMSLINHS
jgi:esterase/lipase